eukprot:8735937-Pyramimonas_sp.AAC.1
MATFRHDDGPTASARTTGDSRWETLCEELLLKVLSTLAKDGGLGGQTSSTMRSVCHSWRAIHDAHLTRMRPSKEIDDATLRALLDCFPALATIQLDRCSKVTDGGIRALSGLSALAPLDLRGCDKVTYEGIRALSVHSALTDLDLGCCRK